MAMKFSTLVLAGSFLCVGSPLAHAYCSEPSVFLQTPSAPTYEKPSTPYCLSGYKYSQTHSCSEWEIERFIDDINDYVQSLNSFAEEANGLARAAIDFANQAQEYATCEADLAKNDWR